MRVDTHGLVVASKSLSYTVGPLICREHIFCATFLFLLGGDIQGVRF